MNIRVTVALCIKLHCSNTTSYLANRVSIVHSLIVPDISFTEHGHTEIDDVIHQLTVMTLYTGIQSQCTHVTPSVLNIMYSVS